MILTGFIIGLNVGIFVGAWYATKMRKPQNNDVNIRFGSAIHIICDDTKEEHIFKWVLFLTQANSNNWTYLRTTINKSTNQILFLDPAMPDWQRNLLSTCASDANITVVFQ